MTGADQATRPWFANILERSRGIHNAIKVVAGGHFV